MELKECIGWLKIMYANLNAFPEISCNKKKKALEKAIEELERMVDYDTNENS